MCSYDRIEEVEFPQCSRVRIVMFCSVSLLFQAQEGVCVPRDPAAVVRLNLSAFSQLFVKSQSNWIPWIALECLSGAGQGLRVLSIFQISQRQ